MARHIEPGSVLSQEDYEYLQERCRVDEALNIWGCTLGEGVGDEEARTAPEIVGVDLSELQTEAPVPAPEPGTLHSVHPDQVEYIANSQEVVVGADVVDDDEEVPPYTEWKKADLLAEIERRNEGRADDDLIEPVSEKNADLAAALSVDDEAHPED